MSQTHILLMEDAPIVREVLLETLTLEGYAVSVAANGTEGLHMAKSMPVHIVVTDLQLPDIDGISIIDRLARLDAKIIPIMVTGFGPIETAVRAMKSGAYDFITKPFEPETVVVVVRKAAEMYRLRRGIISCAKRFVISISLSNWWVPACRLSRSWTLCGKSPTATVP